MQERHRKTTSEHMEEQVDGRTKGNSKWIAGDIFDRSCAVKNVVLARSQKL